MSATIGSKYLDAALAYAARGWRVIPTMKKTPRIKEWPEKASTDSDAIRRLFATYPQHDGVGIRFGEDSGIIDIECDDPEAEATLLELFDGSIPRTPTFGSTRGKHRLFRWHDQIPRQDVSVFKLGKLEFRTGANGKGAQTVFPPSAKRAWIISPDECEPAEIPDSVIERIKARVVAIAEAKTTSKTNSKANGTRHQSTHSSPLDIIDCARRYLAAIPSAVSGEGGHPKTFLAAQHLVRGFELSDQNAFDLLAEWNRACEPPWTDDELRHKIQSARTDGNTVAIGEHLRDSRARRLNGSVRPNSESGDDELPPENDNDIWTSVREDEGRTEIANARRFVAVYGDDVRFCHPWGKWLTWDGSRWRIDDDGAVMRFGTAIADQVWHQVAEYHTKDTVEFATKTSRASGIAAMLKVAGSMRSVAVAELDANPMLLNVLNGTINLRAGELREHRREDNITKLAPTNYNPDASSYDWDKFLEGVFTAQSLIDFVQRLSGYGITGDVSEQILSVFHGGGSNGKTTLLNAIQDVLGTDYSSAAPPSLLMEKKGESHPTELAGLFGQRLVVAVETGQGARLAEATVKQLTGGDVISARRMREDFWTFSPSHKLILCTNHKPRVRGTDHAIWRRLVLVPFDQKFWNPAAGETGPPELMQDKELPAKLKAEREGILAWMVQGCLAWQHGGLQIPEAVRTATSEYRSENDTLGRFVTNDEMTGQSHADDVYLQPAG